MRYRRMSIDRYSSFGIFFLVIGLLGFVFNNLSLLPNNFYTLNSPKFGTGFEVIFLSLSMLIRNLRVEKENTQEEALQKSQEISQLKTCFMSNMSHELRTPINAIMGIAEIQLEQQTSNEQCKQFQIIKNASLSLLSHVNDILDFEKIENNGLQLNYDDVNPSILLRQINHNRQFGGTGLGLSIVKHLVQLFEGQLKIESSEGKGTEVFIDIPLKSIPNTQRKAHTSHTSIESFKNSKPLHVLIVEDNLMNQMVMRKLLSSSPIVSFAVVNDGSEVLDALKGYLRYGFNGFANANNGWL